MAKCKAQNETPSWQAGVHYEALAGEGRILLPNLPALETLRHRWFWKKRRTPYVPVWSFAKLPKGNQSPEENARLCSIYMRPWTLNPDDATQRTPLLSQLGVVEAAERHDTSSAPACQDRSSAQDSTSTISAQGCQTASSTQVEGIDRYYKHWVPASRQPCVWSNLALFLDLRR